jgi:hypothetical protein
VGRLTQLLGFQEDMTTIRNKCRKERALSLMIK